MGASAACTSRSSNTSRSAIDGDELNRMVEQKLGAGWERMIRETSRSGNEQTLIFVHPEGSRMGMFIVDKDGNEMDVVQISVDPDHLNESIGQYDHSHPGGDERRQTSRTDPPAVHLSDANAVRGIKLSICASRSRLPRT